MLKSLPLQPWAFLDADEFLDDDFCDVFKAVVGSVDCNGCWLTYTDYFLDSELKHWVEQSKLALFRVGKGLYERIDEDSFSQLNMEIHEHPVVQGNVDQIRVPIDHQDYKGLGKFVEKHCDYALWEAKRYLRLMEKDGK